MNWFSKQEPELKFKKQSENRIPNSTYVWNQLELKWELKPWYIHLKKQYVLESAINWALKPSVLIWILIYQLQTGKWFSESKLKLKSELFSERIKPKTGFPIQFICGRGDWVNSNLFLETGIRGVLLQKSKESPNFSFT